MTEYGREGCVELSSHCAQSLHICPKGNVHTSYIGGNTMFLRLSRTCFSSEVCVNFQKLAQTVNLERDG